MQRLAYFYTKQITGYKPSMKNPIENLIKSLTAASGWAS